MSDTEKITFQKSGTNSKALFMLKAYRGEGMLLLAMNWKKGKPPRDFVGFSIEYREPGGNRFYSLKNRISFTDENGRPGKSNVSSLQAPFQKFRWVHFPRNADMKGNFRYMVRPVFMNSRDEFSYGEPQVVDIALSRDTWPGRLNVAFTRGFVSSQAFVDKYEDEGGVAALLPREARTGLGYTPTHPRADEALHWMGFEAADEITGLLDEALKDKKAEVRVVAYELNLPAIADRLAALGNRLKIIIDDSAGHDGDDSAETEAAHRLEQSTGGNVRRNHMGQLQHNKLIVVNGPKVKAAVCGSTNFTWRGFYVQANNAVIVRGARAIKPFLEAFDNYWQHNTAAEFGKTASAGWSDLRLTGVDARVSFSPHSPSNALLESIAADLQKTGSSLFYSLAFIFQTTGPIRELIDRLAADSNIFLYGISDKKTGGLDLQKPSGSVSQVYASELSGSLPKPFRAEPTGGAGTRMHHKFIVADFNKPDARVYFGSYNFSPAADRKNGENLLLVKDRKIAVSFMIEALRIFDHYHFRVAVRESKKGMRTLSLKRPPRKAGEKAWWEEYYSDPRKINDREMFA